MPSDPQPITSLAVGASGTVAEIRVAPEHRTRLLEMGLLVGTSIQLVRYAPLGDPVEIKVRGYNLSLRRHEADQILVRAASGGA
jgi:ferrous iron transport protein A